MLICYGRCTTMNLQPCEESVYAQGFTLHRAPPADRRPEHLYRAGQRLAVARRPLLHPFQVAGNDAQGVRAERFRQRRQRAVCHRGQPAPHRRRHHALQKPHTDHARNRLPPVRTQAGRTRLRDRSMPHAGRLPVQGPPVPPARAADGAGERGLDPCGPKMRLQPRRHAAPELFHQWPLPGCAGFQPAAPRMGGAPGLNVTSHYRSGRFVSMCIRRGVFTLRLYSGVTGRRIIPIRATARGNTMLSKKFMGVALLAAAAVSSSAYAGDRDFNTVAGAVVGAAIGHNAGGRDGAIVGGLVGAAVGNSINTNDRYYDRGRGGRYVETRVYSQPAPVYYEPAPVYYAPPPRYYAPPPRVVYVEPARPYYQEYREERWEHHHHHRDRWDR